MTLPTIHRAKTTLTLKGATAVAMTSLTTEVGQYMAQYMATSVVSGVGKSNSSASDNAALRKRMV